jgi:hypothetical protein
MSVFFNNFFLGGKDPGMFFYSKILLFLRCVCHMAVCVIFFLSELKSLYQIFGRLELGGNRVEWNFGGWRN